MVNNQAAVTSVRRYAKRLDKCLRLSNKIFHLITPYDVIIFFISQLRWLKGNSDISRVQRQALIAYLSLGDIDNQFN
jgi:hypothetical protein